MVNFICGICGKEVDHAISVSIYHPIIPQGGFYICNECLKNKIYPEMMKRLDDMLLNGRDADVDMCSMSQASEGLT